MNKRVISLFFCFLMLVSVAATGCSLVNTGNGEDTTTSTNTTPAESGNPITLTMYIPCEKPVAEEDRAKVEEAINKITKSKFKTQIKLYLPTLDEYYSTIEGVMKARVEEEEQKTLAESELKKAIRAAKAEGIDAAVAESKFYAEHPEWVKYQETEASSDTEETVPETKLNELGMPELKYPDERENQLDIIWLGGYDRLMSYVNDDLLQRLDEELSSSSKALTSYITPGYLTYLKAYLSNSTYAIPNNRPIGEYTYLLLNKEVLNLTQYSKDDGFVSLTDEKCQDILQIVKENYSDKYLPLYSSTGELDIPNFQGNAAVNYTDRETPWTRIIEHKWFEFGKDEQGQDLPKTVISREYSSEWKPGDEPYYPVNDEKNGALYAEYKRLADTEKNVIFGGRLAEYRYYDMDAVIASALKKSEEVL